MEIEQLLERVAALESDAAPETAPPNVKSKIYSALVRRLADDGPLRTLQATKAAGGDLCPFEHAVGTLPESLFGATNPCRICHARVLGERLRHAPIFWPGCPYSEFHQG